ncbi:hypothetical protein MKW94_001473, partial [Papaver nudicaule]|nr:hypothetical protein [Papaver nudicaule]
MDLQFPSIIVLLIFLIPFLFIVWVNGKTSTRHKMPPGPRKLPFIGNLHNMLGLPHHTLSNLAKKYGSFMHLQLGEFSVVVVSSPKIAKQIMNTHGLVFADRPEFLTGKIAGYNSSGIALSPYGDYWKQLRRIAFTELLSEKKVRAFRSQREQEVSSMIQTISLESGSPVNLSDKLSSLSCDIICRAAIGNKCKDQEMLISVLSEGANFAGSLAIEDIFPSLRFLHFLGGTKEKLMRLHKKIDRVLEEMIHERRREKIVYLEEDFVDILLRVQESGELQVPLTNDNIKAVLG